MEWYNGKLISFALFKCLFASCYFQSYKESCSVGNNSDQIIQCIKSLYAIEEAHIFNTAISFLFPSMTFLFQ